jgi:hypothetical protein
MPLRRPEAALFVLVLGIYAYFYQAGGWNQNSRFDLTRALVDRGTVVIDAYQQNTGDKSRRGEHYYSDKAPGVSLMAVPAYAAVRALAGGDDAFPPGEPRLEVAAWLSTVFAVALPSALGVALLALAGGALGLGVGARVGLALAYGLGTLAFPYATLLYGHQVVAALLVAAFAVLARARAATPSRPASVAALAGSGALLGWAVAVEYPAALIAAVLLVYALGFVRPIFRTAWMAAGAAIPAAGLALYHTVAFGGPLVLPYSFSTQKHRHMGFFMGLGAPAPKALWNLTFTGHRGLFHCAPWLLLAVPGAAVLLRRARTRPEGAVCVASFLLFLWLNASLVDWDGGWAMGPRYLIPALPFLAVAAGGLALLQSRRARTVLVSAGATLAAYSAFLMLAGAAVKPEVDSHIKRPFEAYLLPEFFHGRLALSTQSIDSAVIPAGGPRYAWNLGERLFGLSGAASLVPLLAWTLLVGVWLGWATVSESRRWSSTAPAGRPASWS